jgi:hydroxypyruvate isomerase
MPDAPTLHANISMLFKEVELLERPAAAAAAGFDAIECWWPFDGPEPSEAAKDEFIGAVDDAGVRVVAMNLDAGDLSKGHRGLLSDPDQVDRFRKGVSSGVDLAGRLGCRVLHAMYGNRRLGANPREQDALAIEHLGTAAAAAREIDATVVVEALNPWENPLFPWTRTEEIVALADRVELQTGERIACLYDIYHAQRSEGDLIATIEKYVDRIGHVQIADSPGRGEPGTGEIAYTRVLAALRDSGYRGSIGLEYIPTTTTHESLAGLDALRAVLSGNDASS